MSLRVKVECVLFIILGLVVGLGFGIQRFLIIPRLNPLEERIAEKDMQRSLGTIHAQDTLLNEFTGKWARKPDLVQFMQDRNAEYRASALGTERLIEENLSLVYLLDANRGVIWGGAVDLITDKAITLEELPGQKWPQSHLLLPKDDPHSSVNGVFLTGAGPMLVSSHPVTSLESPDMLLGRLVVGRKLDHNLLERAHASGATGLKIWSVTDPGLTEEQKAVLDGLIAGSLRPVSQVTKNIFRVYATYPDIQGTPALLLSSVIYRNVLSKAYDAMQVGLLAQVGIGLTALVLLIVLFRRTVMNPLSRLTTHATNIGESNDLSARLGMVRDDEIGVLANEFDRMVEQLELDMERQKQAEEALRESEERYALAVRGANDGLWDWDLVADSIDFTPRWKSMIGYQEEEIGDQPSEWFDRIHPEDLEEVRSALDAHLVGQTAHFESEHRIRHKENEYLWVLCRGIAVRDDKGAATRMAGSQSDITVRKIFEEQLSRQALYDSLTALPNRALLFDRLTHAIRHVERNPDYLFAVLFLDLDRFKVINESLGHAVGDLLLAAVAEKLQACLRQVDTVARGAETLARFGGDEFVILLDNINDVVGATAIAERIQAVFDKPFEIEGNEIFTSASIGIVVSEKGYKTPEELVRNADTAMYRAKARGAACFEVFDADMHSKAMERLEIENDLRHAIDKQEFVVYYQPIVSLENGAIKAFEALVRWQHPRRGLVSPVDFIPITEETGMILPIGEWVLREACRQVRAWQIKIPHTHEVQISVNLAAKEVAKPGLVAAIEQTLGETGLDPRYLKLEITESAIMESMDVVTSALGKLRDMHIQVSIDDFGTGYSSLGYLHRLPANCLKIDRAFIRDMVSNCESTQIVNTIVLLAHALQMTVVAEGIEEEDQLRRLRELGCEFGQGYIFSPPVDAEAATELLRSERSWLAVCRSA